MKHLGVILLIKVLFVSLELNGQEINLATLKGRLLDIESKAPIPYANIFIKSLGIGSITDSSGSFNLKNLKPKVYNISLSALGYEDKEEFIAINAPVTTINLALKEETLILNELVIRGVSKETSIESKGFEVDAIITKNAKEQTIELNDILDQSSGVRVKRSGGLGSRVKYQINGLSGNAIRFFLDEIPMELYGSSYSITNIPVNFIKRIDIYKGVSPVSLGSDILGGAINIVPRSINYNSLNFSYSLGSFNTHQANINGNWTDFKTGLKIKGEAFFNFSENNYKIWGDNVFVTDPKTYEIKRGIKVRRFNDGYRVHGSKLDLGLINKNWADELIFGLLFSSMEKESQHGATMDIPFGERTYFQNTLVPSINYKKEDLFIRGLDAKFFSGFANQKRILVDTSKNRYNWYGQIIGINQTGGEAGSPTLLTTHESHIINRINLSYHVTSNTEIELNGLLNNFKRRGDNPLAPPDKRSLGDSQKMKKNILGLSIQNQFFNNRFKTTLFTKYSNYKVNVKDAVYIQSEFIPFYHKKEGFNLGFGAVAGLYIGTDIFISSSFENATRLPESNEIFGNDAENTNSAYELKPESSNNLNLGLTFGRYRFQNHAIKIKGNLFYRDVTNLIQQTNIEGAIDSYVFINLKSILSTGIDFDLNYRFKDNLSINSAISISNTRDATQFDEHGNKNKHFRARIPNQPYFQQHYSIRYLIDDFLSKNDRITFNWGLNYVHKFYRKWENIGKDNKDIIPSQLTQNFGGNYVFGNRKFSVGIDLKNIFNKQVYDQFAIQQPGRAFFLKLSYTSIKKQS